jgi:alcohol dehydrogenase class IV
MMNNQNFYFSTSHNIIFGVGKISELSNVIEMYGNKVLIIRTPLENNISKVINIIEKVNKKWISYSVDHEPTTAIIDDVVKSAREFNTELVIAIGGGSVMDTGKAVSALLTNPGQLIDYLEIVGKGLPLQKKSVPLIAIPTTAGTGSEVTRNAVIEVPEKKVKVSLRGLFIQPEVALIDPELTLSVPAQVTAYSGMDAFIQVIEPYVSTKANLMTDIFCREGIKNAANSLLKAYSNGNDLSTRVNMSWVSLLGGICLANSGLGAVHGFAGPIGGMFHIPHGAICASLLPAVMEVNIIALQQRVPDSISIDRYKEIFNIVTGKPNTSVQNGLNWFKELYEKLQLPSLRKLGISKDNFSDIIMQSKVASSMKANPILLNDAEINEILEKAF